MKNSFGIENIRKFDKFLQKSIQTVKFICCLELPGAENNTSVLRAKSA
jgi:hypothetical protein